MDSKKMLAYMYDFYNLHTLKGQNDDIKYYKEQIKYYNAKTVLIVGAGTGRVAIPLNDVAKVTALDFDEGRLEVLKEKLNSIETICCNIKEFITNKQYDMIIFPYSTIQFSNSEVEIDSIIKQLLKFVSSNTVILFDISDSFRYKEDKENLFLFTDYCNEVLDKVSVYYTSKKYDKYIEFNVIYKLESKNLSLLEHEKYYYYEEKMYKKLFKQNNLNILKIDQGYGDGNFTHKHIYHVKKGASFAMEKFYEK